MNKILKYTIFLLVLGIIAGGLLALVNGITAPIIEQRAKDEATKSLRQNFTYKDYSFNLVESEYANVVPEITGIYYAFDESDALVAVIYETAYTGYERKPIVCQIAINADGSFSKLVIVTQTPEPTNKPFVLQDHDFALSGNVSSFTYNAISGATISTTAVANGLNAAAAHFASIQGNLGGVTNE
jgi:electron transport complex protein RnfG